MADAELYRVRAQSPLHGGRYEDAHTIIFHQMINSGGSTLANVLGAQVTRLGKHWENVQAVRENPDAFAPHRRDCSFLYGHNAFGLEQFVDGPFYYFTMLREPVVAYVSRFHNWSFMNPTGMGGYTLEQFVEEGRNPNHQARDLARCHSGSTKMDFEIGEDEIFDRAKEALEQRIAFCGITDLFDETIFLICAIFGWKEIGMWKRRLSTPGRPPLESLNPDLRSKIEELVRVDQAIYDRQRAKLLALLSEANFDSEFGRYKTDAAETGAQSFDDARVQKYELLINSLRREIQSRDELIAEQKHIIRSSELGHPTVASIQAQMRELSRIAQASAAK